MMTNQILWDKNTPETHNLGVVTDHHGVAIIATGDGHEVIVQVSESDARIMVEQLNAWLAR